jgi:hypothetical protein
VPGCAARADTRRRERRGGALICDANSVDGIQVAQDRRGMSQTVLENDKTTQNDPPAVLNTDDLGFIARPLYPNALLIGSHARVAEVTKALIPRLRPPIVQCDGTVSSALQTLERGTLFIANVERLSLEQQQRLMEFLVDGRRSVQCIATSNTDLFSRVQSGEFLEALYYRLNSVLVLLSEVAADQGIRES